MEISVPTSTSSAPLALDQPTLLVGDLEELLKTLPNMRDELSACQQLHSCGELPSEDPAAELWNRIARLQPQRLWIVGGDGTINLVGQCLLRADRHLPCWLTPAGTANDLARALAEHSTRAVAAAIENQPLAVLQPTVQLDLLSVKLDKNPWLRCAANMFTLGTSARNTHHVTSEIKARWGALAYLTQIWRAMGDLEPFSVTMAVGDSEHRTVNGILNIFIANGPYCGGGFRVAPTAQIDDHLLDVLIVKAGTTAELAHLATTFITGGHAEHPLVEHFTAKRVSLVCEESSPLTLDGETFEAKEIEIEIRPGSLPINLVTSE